MFRFSDVRAPGGVPLLLTAFASVSVLAAAAFGGRPVSTAVPDHLLGRIRGTMPGVGKKSEGGCTTINVNTLNLFDPPGGPPSAVSYADCGGHAGTMCISCTLGPGSISYTTTPGGNPNVQTQATIVDCNIAATQGTCAVDTKGNPFCENPAGYDCATYGTNYPPQ